MHTTEVDGHPAWVLDAVLRPGQAAGPALCNRTIACYPTILQGDHLIGVCEGMRSRYTVLDVPGAGITVLWSWGLDGEIPPAVDDLVASIEFS